MLVVDRRGPGPVGVLGPVAERAQDGDTGCGRTEQAQIGVDEGRGGHRGGAEQVGDDRDGDRVDPPDHPDAEGRAHDVGEHLRGDDDRHLDGGGVAGEQQPRHHQERGAGGEAAQRLGGEVAPGLVLLVGQLDRAHRTLAR
ncbi:hypothetical protein F4553_006014 [Allocatelliglobosispora scoriae]|uniref:Uncharacterized protein n=1 Tax=Allocatelliglobosispora scoriae TaxID=643052 RepID=A0A841C0U0_9ACTN|nr:hypothetical protein [Allocatelliglobosispora scoriae]MBB5872580.1 hypothetical protein [Allocatelliglobosispora scoriae]